MQEALFDLPEPSVTPPAPASQPLPEKPIQTTFKIAGLQHRCSEGQLRAMRLGDQVAFSREPSNRYDPNAIQVRWNGRHVGYVPRTVAKDLAPAIDAGWGTRGMLDIIEPGPTPAAWGVRVVMKCWPAAAGDKEESA